MSIFALPSSVFSKSRILVVDLGFSTTKAVYLDRDGEHVRLLGYSIDPAPSRETENYRDNLAQHLQAIRKKLGVRTRRLILTVGWKEAVFRPVDLPDAPRSELRKILGINPTMHLQQEVADHTFDCCECIPLSGVANPDSESSVAESQADPFTQKAKRKTFLVAGIGNTLLRDLKTAAQKAKFILEEVTLSPVALLASAWKGIPDELNSKVTALVDIGLTKTIILILRGGELVVSRMIPIGGAEFTTRLAEAMNINYPAAEAVKLTMPEKVEAKLRNVIAPLGEELRAAVDFFEKQHERHVDTVYFSGASVRSKMILQILEGKLSIHCQTWDPTSPILIALQNGAQLEPGARDQLAVALGAGENWFSPTPLKINLLAEQQEQSRKRRRDPINWAIAAGILLIVAMLAWAGYLKLAVDHAESQLPGHQAYLKNLQKVTIPITQMAKQAGAMELVATKMTHFANDRFHWSGPLDALQYTVVDQVELVRIRMESNVIITKGTPAITNANQKITPAKPATGVEHISVIITAKDYGDPPAAEDFVKAILAAPFFEQNLRPTDPILLQDRLPAQADPLDPTKTFVLFKIGCFLKPRVLRDE